MHYFQRTLKRPVTCTGIGLHSGKKVTLSLRPAEPNTGVLFKRTDVPGSALIPGDVHNVVDTRFCTTVGRGDLRISTVEHLMSALAGLGVDNVLVEVDSPEIPIMDGSSAPFVFLIKNAGLTSQRAPRQFYQVRRKVTISEGDKQVTVMPADEMRVDFTIEFDHPLIRTQRMGFELDSSNYDKNISRARTFGFLSDLAMLKEHNLALGGSLDNAVVVDDYQVLNEDGLRFPDEFVRHKILDFIGDLSLVGRPIVGAFVAHKSGHDLNNQLFRKFLADPQAWELVTPEKPQLQAIPSVAPVLEQAVA
ncbi:UDP-3-O-acyl-N-acetylglucosamine deacetylase [Dethiosulfatarculus sandiegensis]|uniref:UDP-3-O-acyl-N-acetylglucosamine deacetylase n=1 Tax=Dethiosulfatarculus sandiegensis TaxID=1429043 RepID=A0A0D2HXU7_9BACT|nr:UDP-3-O-acyl-N-acetylglucosamine deacetylase [Dethiosulfatarculus sandiegensis]KIX15123.1 UDP-3-O-(3-hydroxymyristoyl) glucosamine N-acyltransferase [Dethiosulfatarculus sandiegensis]